MPVAYTGGDADGAGGGTDELADGAIVDAGGGTDELAAGTYVAKYSSALNGVAKPVGRLESV